MILVTLGTQDKTFERLLQAVQKQIDGGNITGRVIVQAGSTKFHSEDMEILSMIPMDKLDELMEQCDLLITHGGIGSIIAGLNNNKTVIAAPRLKQYKEHANDHQLELIRNFSQSGYILALHDFDKLDEVLQESKSFQPKKFTSNTANMIKLIDDFIQAEG